VFERTHSKGRGCVSKGRAPIRNDGVTFRKDRLVFEMTQLCFERMGLRSKRRSCVSKRRARVRNDVVVFERTGSCLKRWGSVHKDGLALEMLLVFEKTGLHSKTRSPAHVAAGVARVVMGLWCMVGVVIRVVGGGFDIKGRGGA